MSKRERKIYMETAFALRGRNIVREIEIVHEIDIYILGELREDTGIEKVGKICLKSDILFYSRQS